MRVALGAQAGGVVVEILRKPLSHVAAGAVLGCVPVGGMMALSMRGGDPATMTGPALLLVAHAIVMTGVCALACVGPARRALRVQPTDALREDY